MPLPGSPCADCSLPSTFITLNCVPQFAQFCLCSSLGLMPTLCPHTHMMMTMPQPWLTQLACVCLATTTESLSDTFDTSILMCRHPSVEFRALQTELHSSSRFRDSDHIQAFEPPRVITVVRVFLTHRPQFKQQHVLWSGSDLQPSNVLRFTKDQHGQRRHTALYNWERNADLGRVVGWDQHSLHLRYTDTVESSLCEVPHM